MAELDNNQLEAPSAAGRARAIEPREVAASISKTCICENSGKCRMALAGSRHRSSMFKRTEDTCTTVRCASSYGISLPRQRQFRRKTADTLYGKSVDSHSAHARIDGILLIRHICTSAIVSRVALRTSSFSPTYLYNFI